jgi:lipopolysaccharide export system permease protein
MVFTPIIFVLLGIVFALKPLKTQSVAKGVGFCFLVVFIYLIIFRLMVSVGKGGYLPPIIAGWTPNFIFLGLASIMIWKRK